MENGRLFENINKNVVIMTMLRNPEVVWSRLKIISYVA